jgi:hypothetical protein
VKYGRYWPKRNGRRAAVPLPPHALRPLDQAPANVRQPPHPARNPPRLPPRVQAPSSPSRRTSRGWETSRSYQSSRGLELRKGPDAWQLARAELGQGKRDEKRRQGRGGAVTVRPAAKPQHGAESDSPRRKRPAVRVAPNGTPRREARPTDKVASRLGGRDGNESFRARSLLR